MSQLFIGRRRELAEFGQAAESARAGHPKLVAVFGQPGSGKSHLVSEASRHLATNASVDIHFRSTRLDLEPSLARATEEIRRDPWLSSRPSAAALGTGASDTRSATHSAPNLASLLLRTIQESAASRLTVLRLEDIHWADTAEDDRFLYELAASIQSKTRHQDPCHLLITMTCRPGEAGAEVEQTIERLMGSIETCRLDMQPLTEPEVDRLIRPDSQQPPSGALLQQVLDVTQGLPLLVAEAARVLDAGDVTRLAEVRNRLPRTAHDLARQRLAEVSRTDRMILATAALSKNPTARIIGLALDLEVTAVIDALDRFCESGIMVAGPFGNHFAHPTLTEAVVDGLSVDRRHLIHAGLADACRRSNAPLLETAWHLLSAGDAAIGEPNEICSLLDEAARRSLTVGDQRMAAQLLERRLALTNPDDHGRGHLHYEAALAHYRDRSPTESHAHLDEAYRHALSAEDDHALAKAMTLRNRLALTGDMAAEPIQAATEFLASERAIEPSARTAMLSDLADYATMTGSPSTGERYAQAAMESAALAGSSSSNAIACFGLGLSLWGQLRLGAAAVEFEKSQRFAEKDGDEWLRCWGRGRLPLIHLMEGKATLAAATAADAEKSAIDIGNQSEVLLALGVQLAAAVARGRFDEADALGGPALDLLHRTQYSWAISNVLRPLAIRRAVVGDHDGALELVDLWTSLRPTVPNTARAYLNTLAGRQTQLASPDLGSFDPVTPMFLARSLWAAPLLPVDGNEPSDDGVTEPLRAALQHAVKQGAWSTPDALQLVPRFIIGLHRRVGDTEAAIEAGVQARSLAERGDLELELALTALEEAETYRSVSRKDGREAAALAGDIADELGLVPVAKRADEIATELGARTTPQRRPGHRRAILFTDIVGSTPLNRSLGDVDYVTLLAAHDRVLHDCVDATNGHTFQHTGDGIGAWFIEAGQAADCALEMQRSIALLARQRNIDVAIRIGIVVGPVIERGDDISGLELSRANRVMSQADAGQIIVDEQTAGAVGQRLHVVRQEPARLKGFAEPHILHELLDPEIVEAILPATATATTAHHHP